MHLEAGSSQKKGTREAVSIASHFPSVEHLTGIQLLASISHILYPSSHIVPVATLCARRGLALNLDSNTKYVIMNELQEAKMERV